MLQPNTQPTTHAVTLKATGDLRLGKSSAWLRTATDELLERGVRVLALDLSTVGVVDAAGIGALLETRHRVEESGAKLVLLRPTERVRQLLDVCALTALFHVVAVDPGVTDA